MLDSTVFNLEFCSSRVVYPIAWQCISGRRSAPFSTLLFLRVASGRVVRDYVVDDIERVILARGSGQHVGRPRRSRALSSDAQWPPLIEGYRAKILRRRVSYEWV